MKLVKNSKGFTLIEVVVGMAIMGVVAMVVTMMLTAGTNMFVSVYSRSGLMFRSQVASLQIRDIFTDCEGIASLDDNLIAIADEDQNKLYRFYFDETEATIYIDDYNVDPIGKTIGLVEERIPLCTKVKEVYLPPDDNAFVTGKMEYMKLVLTLANNNITYVRNEIISFRSNPALITTLTTDDEAAGIDTLENKLIYSVWEE